jgi:hypothetical protein
VVIAGARRFAVAGAVSIVALLVAVVISFEHPRTRAQWFVLEDRLLWRNPRVVRALEAALVDCSIEAWGSPLPIAAMIVQDKADPCAGDRLPSLLRPHLTPANQRILFAYLARHHVSDAATKRIVRAELVAGRPIPELAWRVLDAPDTSPRLRYEVAADVLASDATDGTSALERLPRVHGVGTLVMFQSFGDGNGSLRAVALEMLATPPPLRALPGDADGAAFQRWIAERTSLAIGPDLADVAREVARVHAGLLPRSVPSELYASLRSAPAGTCETVGPRCVRLLAQLLRVTRDRDLEPAPELWPELGKGATAAWLVDGAVEWVTRAATPEDRAMRILAIVAHPKHDGVGADPVGALTWGAGTPGAVAALASELARRADVPIELTVEGDGRLRVALPSATATIPSIGAPASPGPLPHPADLARAEALAVALELGDLTRARDVAGAFEDPDAPWVAALIGEVAARTPPPPLERPKKGTRRR